jgi:iron(III) transport system ATP-binding protein
MLPRSRRARVAEVAQGIRAPGARVDVVDLGKVFGEAWVVADASFSVAAGAFLTILGPSGCGKTTTLRMIAGLEVPDRGEVRIGGETMSSSAVRRFIAPEHRRVGFVHQSYALWPHMNVTQHLAYPLQNRRLPEQAIREKVSQTLELVDLASLARRYPSELSGGQQQRVALARAIVQEPEVLLLDEPLSNLDAALRTHMGSELRRLQQEVGVTAIYVTHDRLEALSLSDHLLVMEGGRAIEFGTPTELYESPKSLFAAQFVSAAAVIGCHVADVGRDTSVTLETGERITVSDKGGSEREAVRQGQPASIAIRPEEIRVSRLSGTDEPNSARGRAESVMYFGSYLEVVLSVAGTRIRARIPPDGVDKLAAGEEVAVTFPREHVVLLPWTFVQGQSEPAT